MMIPVPSPVPRRLWATMSTTDGSTLARMPFTSRAAPDSGGAEAPEPEAGAVVAVDPGPGDGMGVVVAPPAGAVAGVTAGESEPCLEARLTPMAAPRLPATRARMATPPTSARVRRPATGRVPWPSPGGGADGGGNPNPDGPPSPGGAGGGSVGGDGGRLQSPGKPSVMSPSSSATLGVCCERAWSRPRTRGSGCPRKGFSQADSKGWDHHPPGGYLCFGKPQCPAMLPRVVESMTAAAAALPLSTTPAMWTVSPVFTLPMPSRPEPTRVFSSTL